MRCVLCVVSRDVRCALGVVCCVCCVVCCVSCGVCCVQCLARVCMIGVRCVLRVA